MTQTSVNVTPQIGEAFTLVSLHGDFTAASSDLTKGI